MGINHIFPEQALERGAGLFWFPHSFNLLMNKVSEGRKRVRKALAQAVSPIPANSRNNKGLHFYEPSFCAPRVEPDAKFQKS